MHQRGYEIRLHRGTRSGSRPEWSDGRVSYNSVDRLFFVATPDGAVKDIPFENVPSELRDALLDGYFAFGRETPAPGPNETKPVLSAILRKIGLA